MSRDTFDADRSEDPIFIHSTIDDAELDVYEFRILFHLKRRANKKQGGKAYPGAKSMAAVCGMSETKVREAVKGLERRKMLYVVRSAGGRDANHYYLTAPKDWILTPSPHEGHPCATRGGGVRHTQGTPSPDDGEGNQSRESTEDTIPGTAGGVAELPLEGESTMKEKALKVYEEYPRKTAKHAGVMAIMRALKKCPFEKLLNATRNYAASVSDKEPQFLPYPATWFNQRRYDDHHETTKSHDPNRDAAKSLW